MGPLQRFVSVFVNVCGVNSSIMFYLGDSLHVPMFELNHFVIELIPKLNTYTNYYLPRLHAQAICNP